MQLPKIRCTSTTQPIRTLTALTPKCSLTPTMWAGLRCQNNSRYPRVLGTNSKSLRCLSTNGTKKTVVSINQALRYYGCTIRQHHKLRSLRSPAPLSSHHLNRSFVKCATSISHQMPISKAIPEDVHSHPHTNPPINRDNNQSVVQKTTMHSSK